ncbi:MAG TPA: ATP-binding cassette domain-containing protein [Solirubrobacteraceae bacterium]|jgi:branched-chain amino acid transport system ATP-binding protein|nr:ATP-binding cassette domain-containing protein [Solirubrobacteraceae bacterium]
MSGLAVQDAYGGYAGTDVLRGVSIEVLAGQCVAVLGPNGAGKSTLLRLMSGQLKLRAGVRRIDDDDATKWHAFQLARAGVRWVGEPRPIFPTLTVEENLEIGGITKRSEIPRKQREIYEMLPILEEKRKLQASSLSGGQQQMLAIAQALMTDPSYLCLDEPSIGLAPSIVSMVAELVVKLTSQNVGILWAEQFPEVALSHCTHAMVLGAGRILSQGPVAELDRDILEAAYLGKRTPAAA